jgi:hypothetical protein
MRVKFAVIGMATLGSVAFVSGSASAMPNGLPKASQIAGQMADVDQVRWVCNPWAAATGARTSTAPTDIMVHAGSNGPRPWGPHRHWHHS